MHQSASNVLSSASTLHEALTRADYDGFACFTGSDLTLRQIRALIVSVIGRLKDRSDTEIAVYCEDSALFCVAICACLYSGRTPMLFQAHMLGGQADSFSFLLTDSSEVLSGREGLLLTDSPGDETEALAFDDLPKPLGCIGLCTSGSTGMPKTVFKTLTCMELEAVELRELLGARLGGLELCASVFSGHLYGLTFGMFLPLLAGIPIRRRRISHGGELTVLQGSLAFVTTPAFLRRLDYRLKAPQVAFAISASGLLDSATAASFIRWSGCSLDEIYGSTETGVMAHRVWERKSDGGRTLPEQPFRLLKVVKMIRYPDGFYYVMSPLCSQDKLRLDDDLGFVSNDSFLFRGRRGRTIKIEDQRINLDFVEKLVVQLPEVADCAALAVFNGHRTELAIAMALEPNSSLPGGGHDRRTVLEQVRRYLMPYLPQVCLPRRLRVVPALPRDIQGKLQAEVLAGIFEDNAENQTAVQ